LLAEFIWDNLYDGKAKRRCGSLEVSNPIQLKIVQFVVKKSSEALEDYYKKGQSKKIEEIAKCVFMTKFSNTFECSHHNEIRAIKKIQQDAARVVFDRYIERKKEKTLTVEEFGEIFKIADQAFQFEMIDLAVSARDPIRSRLLLQELYNWLPTEISLPAHVKIIKEALTVNPNDRISDWLAGLTSREYFGNFSVEDARDFLSLVVKYKRLNISFLNWICSEYPLELRSYEKEIKAWCLDNAKISGVIQIVRSTLTKKSQRDFLELFLQNLEAGNKLLYTLECEDPEFLFRIRLLIDNNLSQASSSIQCEDLGALVASYGEQKDLEACLKKNSHCSFVTGILVNPVNPKISITPKISQELLVKSKECLSHYLSKGLRRPQIFDLHRAHLFRHNMIDEEIIKNRNYWSDDWVICSEFELLLARNQTINEQQILPFLNSGRFHELKERLVDVWENKLTEEAKELACTIRPYFNCLYRSVEDPRFREAVLNIGTKCLAKPAFLSFETLGKLCLTKAELSAHWFFVKDFEAEIETGGYLGIFDVARNAAQNFA
jgi:hypothetical protein